MQFELITLSGVLFSGEVTEVSLPTVAGQLSILPKHEALTSVASSGAVIIRSASGEAQTFVLFGGILDITSNHVRLLADEAEHSNELDEVEIAAALAEAERLKLSASSVHDITTASRMVERQTIRLGVAKLKRRHKS
jgi:F-type H+-transporting ATPase subunit epsilon